MQDNAEYFKLLNYLITINLQYYQFISYLQLYILTNFIVFLTLITQAEYFIVKQIAIIIFLILKRASRNV